MAGQDDKSPAEPEEAEPEPAMADDPTSPADCDDSSSSEMSVTAPRSSRSMSRGKRGHPESGTLGPPTPAEPEKAKTRDSAKASPKEPPIKPEKAKTKDLLSRRRKKRMMMMMMRQSLKRLSIKKEKEKAQGKEGVRMQMTTWMEGLTKGLTKGLRKGLEKGLVVGQILHQWLLKQQPEPVKGCLS